MSCAFEAARRRWRRPTVWGIVLSQSEPIGYTNPDAIAHSTRAPPSRPRPAMEKTHGPPINSCRRPGLQRHCSGRDSPRRGTEGRRRSPAAAPKGRAASGGARLYAGCAAGRLERPAGRGRQGDLSAQLPGTSEFPDRPLSSTRRLGSARHWAYGQILPRAYWAAAYFIADYWLFGLEVPPVGYEWVRDGADAILVNVTTGEILQAEYGVFA